MQPEIRLIYQKVYLGSVEKLTIPICSEFEISVKANVIAAICEFPNTTHNFSLERFNKYEQEWEESFIPNSEMNKIL
jgi:hypothetical protein